MQFITRDGFQKIMLRLCGKKLEYAELDSTTKVGPNPDLAAPAAEALASLGIFAADPTEPVDADFASVRPDQLPQLICIGELATLEAVLGNLADPNMVADTNNQQDHGDFYAAIEKTIARKQLKAERLYGYGMGETTIGNLDLGIRQTGPGGCR